MAKEKKGKKQRTAASDGGHLAEATETFARGDYVLARAQLAPKIEDDRLSEGEREMARDLYQATRIDRKTLWVGFAVLALFLLAAALGAIKQP